MQYSNISKAIAIMLAPLLGFASFAVYADFLEISQTSNTTTAPMADDGTFLHKAYCNGTYYTHFDAVSA